MARHELCERYGFDWDTRRRHLALLRLDAVRAGVAETVQERVIRPHIDAIVEGFYGFLRTQPAARRFFDDPRLVERLRVAQSSHLRTLGLGVGEASYFENRLRVGLIHRKVGVPLTLYQGAYAELQCSIVNQLETAINDPTQRRSARDFLMRVIALDMSLAIETYHRVAIHEMEASLTSLRREKLELRRVSQTDGLTGIANREHAMTVLERAIEGCQSSTSVLMIDVDHFKAVNDTHGHLVGDQALIHVARRIAAAVRDVDAVGRYGGEEFIAVLHGADGAVGHRVAERIRADLRRNPALIDGLRLAVSVTIGVAEARPGESAAEMVGRADEALYRGKLAGRNRTVPAVITERCAG